MQIDEAFSRTAVSMRKQAEFQEICTQISLSLLSLATNVTLGANDLWLGIQTGAGGTATLTESFFDHSPWLHGQQDTMMTNYYFYKMLNHFCKYQDKMRLSKFHIS